MTEYTFSEAIRSAAERIVRFGSEHGITLGTAESCTGGLVSGAVTAVPGSSEVLLGGIVSYSPAVKHAVLGVSESIIREPGVVSYECAEAMAAGAQNILGCDVAVSITGIAGPGGAEPGKPVGTVFFGVSCNGNVRSYRMCFDGDRSAVRTAATAYALERAYEGMVKVFEANVLQ